MRGCKYLYTGDNSTPKHKRGPVRCLKGHWIKSEKYNFEELQYSTLRTFNDDHKKAERFCRYCEDY